MAGAKSIDAPKNQIPFTVILFFSWAGIVGLLFLRFVWHQISIHNRFKNAECIDKQSFPLDLEELIRLSGIKRSVHWVISTKVNAPITMGLFRSTVVIPSDLTETFSKNQLKWILLHELAHIRRHDIFVRFAQGLVQIVFFFNPAIYLINLIMDQQREYACDDLAILGAKTSRKECGKGF